jgi:hypothetical protein
VHDGWDAATDAPADVVVSESFTIAEAGYHTLDLPGAVPFDAGDEVVISVRFAAQDGAEPPLVCVLGGADASSVPTYRGVADGDGAATAWEPFEATEDECVFYLQAIMAE